MKYKYHFKDRSFKYNSYPAFQFNENCNEFNIECTHYLLIYRNNKSKRLNAYLQLQERPWFHAYAYPKERGAERVHPGPVQ